MAEVKLRKIVKKYDEVEAVRGIDLDIADHEFVVLVGPSGCGKSTTLRMIAGLEDITGGEVLIGGDVVNDVPPKDRDIAMVFQNYALYPHMTVFQNMSFGLRLKRYPKKEIKQRVDEAARILDITELLDRKPKQLSGGQRQRVAMGRAIVRNPSRPSKSTARRSRDAHPKGHRGPKSRTDQATQGVLKSLPDRDHRATRLNATTLKRCRGRPVTTSVCGPSARAIS